MSRASGANLQLEGLFLNGAAPPPYAPLLEDLPLLERTPRDFQVGNFMCLENRACTAQKAVADQQIGGHIVRGLKLQHVQCASFIYHIHFDNNSHDAL